MLYLLLFLIFQLTVNLIFNKYAGVYVRHIFCVASFVGFFIMIMVYPFLIMNFQYQYLYKEGSVKCGNAFIGLYVFMWIIGMPIVMILQFIYNKYLLKFKLKQNI